MSYCPVKHIIVIVFIPYVFIKIAFQYIINNLVMYLLCFLILFKLRKSLTKICMILARFYSICLSPSWEQKEEESALINIKGRRFAVT